MKRTKTNFVTQQQLKTIRGGAGIGHVHSNKDVLDLISSDMIHSHDNKEIIDSITQGMIDGWETARTLAHSHQNRAALDLLRYNAALNVIYVGDEDNRVSFAAYGNVAAGGIGTGGGGGGGLIRNVYGYEDIEDVFSASDKTNTFNAYTTARLAQRIKTLEDEATAVSYTPIVTSGTALGKITIDSTNHTIFCPELPDLSTIEKAILSLQSQVDSVASRTDYDELTTVSLFADNIAGTNIYGALHGNADSATNADTLDGQHASYFQPLSTAINTNNIGNQSVAYATSAGNADTVDGEHSSAFAHIAAHNNLMAGGNEFTFASNAFSGPIYLNYRTAGGTNGAISDYYFCDGAARTIWAMSTVAAEAHNGQTAYDDLSTVSRAIQSLQSQVLSAAGRETAELEILEAVVSESLVSLQSQINSLAAKSCDDEITASTIHAATMTSEGIYCTGNILAYKDVAAGSDRRWKENITGVSDDIIDRLQPCEWDWKPGHGSGHSAGLIAQQVMEVIPFAVKGDETSGYMLNYNVFHAYEIKELQNLRKRVRELENSIAALQV